MGFDRTSNASISRDITSLSVNLLHKQIETFMTISSWGGALTDVVAVDTVVITIEIHTHKNNSCPTHYVRTGRVTVNESPTIPERMTFLFLPNVNCQFLSATERALIG
jgi:hypothetical protein